MSILIIDVGTTSVRASAVGADGHIEHMHRVPILVQRSVAGIVEFDANALAKTVIELAEQVQALAGSFAAVGITAQRASTVVWDRRTGEAIAPAIGWQDLRTIGQCLALQASGLHLAPNQSATKLASLLVGHEDEAANWCFGTVDSWISWTLSGTGLHVTDTTNAAITGLVRPDASGWDHAILEILHLPEVMFPTIVESSGVVGQATRLRGAPPIAGLVGDQQSSLIGQGCCAVGQAKATFGSGGMLDCSTGTERSIVENRGAAGTFPIVTWSGDATVHWGVEAIMLAAGSSVQWLVELGILDAVADSDDIAGSVKDAGGVLFVPALEGLGTPIWDFGARGTLVGLAGSTSRAEIVRAVLEGIADSGADLLDAVESDTGLTVSELHVDGGMTSNATFLQLLANATGRPIVPSAALESTTLGAAFLAGTAVGMWGSLSEALGTVLHKPQIDPIRRLDRARWHDARNRSLRTVPALSALSF